MPPSGALNSQQLRLTPSHPLFFSLSLSLSFSVSLYLFLNLSPSVALSGCHAATPKSILAFGQFFNCFFMLSDNWRVVAGGWRVAVGSHRYCRLINTTSQIAGSKAINLQALKAFSQTPLNKRIGKCSRKEKLDNRRKPIDKRDFKFS